MGTSNWQNISYCVELIRKINPRKILDAGSGFGRWGMLSREFLEVWDGKIHSQDWNLQIDSVEVYNRNIEDYYKYFYTNTYNTDIYDFVNSTDEFYDLIIIGDMLEHLDKDRAYDVLSKCIDISRFVILNIPLGKYWEQEALYGNDYERHLSYWNLSDFRKFRIISKKRFKDYIWRNFIVITFSKYEKSLPSNYDPVFAIKFRLRRLLRIVKSFLPSLKLTNNSK